MVCVCVCAALPPPPKGVMLANFMLASGGTHPRNRSIAPSKGGDAVRFLCTPPREVQGQNLFLAPGLSFVASRPQRLRGLRKQPRGSPGVWRGVCMCVCRMSSSLGCNGS